VNRKYTLVFVVALVVRLAWVATVAPSLVWPDEEEFVNVARHLAAGEGYVSISYRANPVLPVYLAAVFRVFGESFLAARIGQAVIGALTCVLVALTATGLLGPTVGLVSGLWLAVYLPHAYLSGVFYAECLFTFLLALTVYGAVRSLDDPHRTRWLLVTGVAFALTALTRPVFLAFLPVLAAALVYGIQTPLAHRLRLVGLVVGAVVLTILPWTVRNYRVLGRPVIVSSGFGTKLWQGNNEGSGGDADDRELTFNDEIWKTRVAALPAPERDAVLARYQDAQAQIDARIADTGDPYAAHDAVLGPLGVAFIQTHPLRAAELFVRKLGTLLLPFSKTIDSNVDTNARNRMIAAAAYLPVLLLMPFGVLWSAGRHRGLWIVYGLLASIAGAYALLTACTRFRLPLDPYLIVFAAVALVELGQRLSRELTEKRARLATNAAHRAAVGHHQPIADHARASGLEADR
jgi:4-amino-4-deoxy-L-arabinose transferase-like glycosyltransferase